MIADGLLFYRTYLEGGNTGRFIAILECIVLSAFAFIFCPELVIVASGEMESPRRNIPRAARRFFYRLIFFYVIGILSVTVLCPSTDKALTDGGSGAGSSPFVIGIKNAGVRVLPTPDTYGFLTSCIRCRCSTILPTRSS